MEHSEADTAGVVAPPPLIFLAGLIVGFALEALLPGAALPALVQWGLGGLLVLAGLGLLASFNASFSRKGTAVEPWKPTTAIVTTGPYRFTRNPAYLGMALVYVGIALLAARFGCWSRCPFVLAVIDRGVIEREERYLERKFGEEYLGYKRTRPALDLSLTSTRRTSSARQTRIARAAQQAEDAGDVGGRLWDRRYAAARGHRAGTGVVGRECERHRRRSGRAGHASGAPGR